MSLHEHVFLDDGSVYVSDRRLIYNTETYSIANLDYVGTRKIGAASIIANPNWRKAAGVSLLYLVTGTLCSIYSPNLSQIILLIGGVLLVIASSIILFQVTLPTYVVEIGGNFGKQPLIKGKDRQYMEKVTHAINQAISAGHGNIIHHTGNVIHHTGNITNNNISHSFNNASHIALGNGAQVIRSSDSLDNGQSKKP